MEDYTISFEFEVVEGYNVYNAKELGYMDNRTNGAEADAWNAFKEANNLASDYFPTNFVVHNEEIYYVDFECNAYMEEWNFENWGVKYWSKTPEFLQYVKEHS